MIRVDTELKERVCQGDIVKDIKHIEHALIREGNIEISKIIFPHVIVLTQDCDLEQNFLQKRKKSKKPNDDKTLISIIVAPLYNVEHVYDGVHLSELGLQMRTINRNKEKMENKYLRYNLMPRYHYLEFPQGLPLTASVIDFKHYFTVGYLENIKSTNFVCKVRELYREDISQRFANFLSRIGLPNI